MKSLKIEKLSYSQLFSFGNFQNETIGITVIAEETDHTKKVVEIMDFLRKEVEDIHNRNESIRALKHEIRQRHSIIDILKHRIKLYEGLDELSTNANEEKLKNAQKEIEKLEKQLEGL